MLRVLPSRLIPNFLQTNMKRKKSQSSKVHKKQSKRKSEKKKKKIRFPKKKRRYGNIIEIGKFIKKVTLHFDLPTSVVNHMIDKINIIVKNHMKQVIGNISKYHDQEKYILRAEYRNKENEFRHKLTEVDKFLNEETKRIEKEHRKLVFLTENMVSNERKLSEKSKEMESKLKKINELEVKLAESIQSGSRSKTVSDKELQHLGETCNKVHCTQLCKDNLKEIEQLKIQKGGFEKIVENQNTLIVNLTAKTNILYKQVQDSARTIENLKQQLQRQEAQLEVERKKKEQFSERTISSSEALTIGTDGEGDHNVEDAIRESHFKLEQLEKESMQIEQKFQQFKFSLQHR